MLFPDTESVYNFTYNISKILILWFINFKSAEVNSICAAIHFALLVLLFSGVIVIKAGSSNRLYLNWIQWHTYWMAWNRPCVGHVGFVQVNKQHQDRLRHWNCVLCLRNGTWTRTQIRGTENAAQAVKKATGSEEARKQGSTVEVNQHTDGSGGRIIKSNKTRLCLREWVIDPESELIGIMTADQTFTCAEQYVSMGYWQ